MTRAIPPPRICFGVSLERWLKILTGTFLAVMFIGPQLEQVSESRRREVRRHAQRIVQTYLVGQTAGVPWPEGSLQAKIDAVVTGRLPDSGVFINRLFRVVVPEEKIDDTYAFIGVHPNGLLFFDPKGSQKPEDM
jgi:hypothetical protein